MSLVHDQAVAARTVTKQQIQLMQAESMGVTRAFLGASPSSVCKFLSIKTRLLVDAAAKLV
jgi:hypothetical protein